MRTITSATLLAFAMACGTDRSASTPAGAAERADSAGIEIVRNSEAKTPSGFVWTVDSIPTVDIGLRDGAPEYLLSRVVTALRLRDGRILVAESDARLRYYDATGKHDTTVSRHGQGPGEVGGITRMLPYIGDSLLIIGGASGTGGRGGMTQIAKLVVLDSRGSFGSQSTMKLSSAGARTITMLTALGIEGVLQNGHVLLRRVGAHPIEGAPGKRWRPDFYASASRDGDKVDTIIVRQSSDIDETPERLPLQNFTTPLFIRRTMPTAVAGPRLYWGNGDSFEVHMFDLSHPPPDTLQPSRIVRYDLANRATESSVLDRYLILMLRADSTAADSSVRREEHKSTPFRPTLPAFQSMLVDGGGNLWVEHFRVSSYARASSFLTIAEDGVEKNVWTVFDSTGSRIGDVITPPGLNVTQIGTDWLLGIWADEDDVQHVRLHRVAKTGVRSPGS